MSKANMKKSCLLIFCFSLFVSTVQAQQYREVSARNALELIATQFGPDSQKWVAEMSAVGGQPQPLQWEVLTYDAQSPGLLHQYTVAAGRAIDGGPEQRRYPNDVPNGYFTGADLGVDSVAAFTIAEAEARKSRLGFDSCDYFLRVREFSRETVWRLELIDATRRLVGQVYISGSNGAVLRTVWVQRDTASGYPRVSDSSLPSRIPYTGIARGENLRNREPVPGQSGLTLSPPPANPGGPRPFTPVSPDGTVTQTPSGPPMTTTPSRNIFREFPTSGGGGGGGSVTVRPPVVSVPQPKPVPPSPVNTNPAPPIPVPRGSGSTERIPPPPIPQ